MKQKQPHEREISHLPRAETAELQIVTKGKQAPATTDLLQWSVPRLIGAGYGLFSRKAADPRWPEFFITAFVLRKYRGISSFWFMIRHAMRGVRKHEIVAGETKALIAKLIGSKPHQLHQLSGIYRAMREERGAAVATAAIVEIIRISNQKRTEKLAWWKPRRKKAPRSQVPATRKSAQAHKPAHSQHHKKKKHKA